MRKTILCQLVSVAAIAVVVSLHIDPAIPADNKSSEVLGFGEVLKMSEVAETRGNILTALDTVRELEKTQRKLNPDDLGGIPQVMMLLTPLVGDYRAALRYGDFSRKMDSIAGENEPGRTVDIDGLRPMNAISEIASAAEDNQIVMLNEAHHVPQHRAFSIELLAALRMKGFSYFAAETLSESDAALNDRGYPIRDTGYYSDEPVYGDLIRTSIRLGYRVVPYEARPFKNADEREQKQAQNLYERILKDDPAAKVFVHAGYDHINEVGELSGAITMAQRLTEITGINPLTIDQTVMTERSSPKYEHPIYRRVMGRGLSQDSVFVDRANKFWTLNPGLRDITVFHPRSTYKGDRPTWLSLGGIRHMARLPKNTCATSGRCLITARPISEGADAIPIDQIEVSDSKRAPILMLPRGSFVIDVQDASGNRIKSFQLSTDTRQMRR